MKKKNEAGNPEKKPSRLANLNLRGKVVQMVILGIAILLMVASIVIRLTATPGTALYVAIDSTIGKFFDVPNLIVTNYLVILETFAIIIFMWAVSLLSSVIIHLVTKSNGRARTIGLLVASIIKYSCLIIGLFMVFSAWGVQTTTLLAGAGILGLAISLGAQTLIDDILSGLGLIFEKTFVVGDIIEVGGFRGKVLEIGIRVTRLENLMGDIQSINNADIRASINTSDNWTPTMIDIGLGHEINLLEVEDKLLPFLPELAKRIPEIKKGPSYAGVQALDAAGVTLRLVIFTHEIDKNSARRKVNRELKLYFDQVGIQVPYTEYLIKNVE